MNIYILFFFCNRELHDRFTRCIVVTLYFLGTVLWCFIRYAIYFIHAQNKCYIGIYPLFILKIIIALT